MTVHARMVWRGFASAPDPQHSQHFAVIAILRDFGLAAAFCNGSRRASYCPFARLVAAASLARSRGVSWVARGLAGTSSDVSGDEGFLTRERISTDSRLEEELSRSFPLWCGESKES